MISSLSIVLLIFQHKTQTAKRDAINQYRAFKNVTAFLKSKAEACLQHDYKRNKSAQKYDCFTR